MDHGPGVSAADVHRLIEPFQRLDDASNRPGVGLGLAVAHGFVTAMGGDLSFTTTPGGGLTATITLDAYDRPRTWDEGDHEG